MNATATPKVAAAAAPVRPRRLLADYAEQPTGLAARVLREDPDARLAVAGFSSAI
jgi:hypothetical protein